MFIYPMWIRRGDTVFVACEDCFAAETTQEQTDVAIIEGIVGAETSTTSNEAAQLHPAN
jgi:hypothetical protein